MKTQRVSFYCNSVNLMNGLGKLLKRGFYLSASNENLKCFWSEVI